VTFSLLRWLSVALCIGAGVSGLYKATWLSWALLGVAVVATALSEEARRPQRPQPETELVRCRACAGGWISASPLASPPATTPYDAAGLHAQLVEQLPTASPVPKRESNS
jgi:hypothetical protein